MKYLVCILLLFAAAGAFAQNSNKPLVQFSGMVYNADSSHVIIPYVNITDVKSDNVIGVSNYEGYFSIVAHERDTLRFTSVGYAPVTVVIPENQASKSYTIKVLLKPQIINLPVFHVFPWATTDEFRKYFLTVKLADDDLEIARKNLSGESLRAAYKNTPRSAQEIQVSNEQAMHNNIVNSHSITNPLLNPIAWGSLIKTITDGDRSSN